jgi:hypothetical protein
METTDSSRYEHEPPKIQGLRDFDESYFQQLEDKNGWTALGRENCSNQRYFTVYSDKGEKLGIIGVYDAGNEKNVTHTVVDQEFRGHGLAAKFKELLMHELKLSFITMTIDLDNQASIRATEKLPGVRKVSAEEYERNYHKVKYVYEKPQKHSNEEIAEILNTIE